MYEFLGIYLLAGMGFMFCWLSNLSEKKEKKKCNTIAEYIWYYEWKKNHRPNIFEAIYLVFSFFGGMLIVSFCWLGIFMYSIGYDFDRIANKYGKKRRY